jgi:NAD(P)-dependent dehydrogenase (short-subunit alcohol dehydrogenase family)
MEDIRGRHAFITGGASGLGLGIARALLDAGMKVTVADFRKDHIESAMALFESIQKGRDVFAVELDVTDRANFARATDAAFAQLGAVDVLVNNAGVGIIGPIADATFSDWDWGIDVNLGGVVNGVTTFLPRMIAQGTGGHIVNTASLSAITPSPRDSAIYATTKAAVMAMSEAMREELADHNIGVSVLLPGPFKTNIREVGRNRPAHYQTGSGYRAVEEQLAEREDAPDWFDPLDAGHMVRDAIKETRLYIITHGEFKGWAESKFEDIVAAYPPPRDPERAKAMGRRRPVRKA